MKLGLLLPANVYFCPYVSIYSRLLDELGVKYDIICWDKTNAVDKADFIFHKKISASDSWLKKLYFYLKYTLFLKKCVKRERYNRLIVFTPQIAIFLYPFLKKYYKSKFILDYRDLSLEQRFMKIYRKVLSISSLNVISSPAFRKCLPKDFNYVVSHNINEYLVRELLSENYMDRDSCRLNILTIGAIRDLDQNIELMNALANNRHFQVKFVGKSDLSDIIRNYASVHGISNACFIGFYQKEEERGYIENCFFMNIYYPRKTSHDTALSNRFYNALVFCKPMIVTKNTIQGDLVEKYGVGIAIENCQNLADNLLQYRAQFNVEVYMKGRNQLLSKILKEQDEFRLSVNNFIK